MSIIFILLLLSTCAASVFSDDGSVLLKIKKQLDNPQDLGNWVKGTNFCYWRSVTCDGSTGRVRTLYLSYFYDTHFSARFPSAICNLTELGELYIISIPGFHGPIPSCISNLSNLRTLHISETSFSGSIPPSLSNLKSLYDLDLSKNKLRGTIPTGLGSLYEVDLSNNYLTGEVPQFYGGINFDTLILRGNRLSGDPSFLLGWPKQWATVIDLSWNRFKFDLTNVELPGNLMTLDLSHNKISGNVSDWIGRYLEAKFGEFYINLSNNKLCGALPPGAAQYNPALFANNSCLCGNPLPRCFNSGPAPAPVSVAPAPAPVFA